MKSFSNIQNHSTPISHSTADGVAIARQSVCSAPSTGVLLLADIVPSVLMNISCPFLPLVKKWVWTQSIWIHLSVSNMICDLICNLWLVTSQSCMILTNFFLVFSQFSNGFSYHTQCVQFFTNFHCRSRIFTNMWCSDDIFGVRNRRGNATILLSSILQQVISLHSTESIWFDSLRLKKVDRFHWFFLQKSDNSMGIRNWIGWNNRLCQLGRSYCTWRFSSRHAAHYASCASYSSGRFLDSIAFTSNQNNPKNGYWCYWIK